MRPSSLRSTGPNFAKSTLGQGRRSMPPTPPPLAAAACGLRRRRSALGEGLDVFAQNAAVIARALDLAEIDAQFARQLAHGRAGIGEREASFVEGADHRRSSGGGRRGRRRRHAERMSACKGAAPVASDRMIEPSLTLSPVLTLISRTVPESGAGTSIVALSDSSAISGSSAFTLSPALTKISMTGTSLKSPISGTRTSATPAGALTGDGGALTTGRASACSARRRPRTARSPLPSLTLSPTFTTTDFTTPSRGDGTSMVALSDSSETSGSSAFTLSPGLTKTSITGTSLKSPMSGTLMSIRLLIALSSARAQTVQGAARPASSSYLAMASATIAGLIAPSSASALSAATAT